MSTSSSPSSFQVYFASALRDYEKLTGATLINHPLSAQLLACNSPGSLGSLLRDQARVVSASLAGGESIGSVRHGRKALMGVLRHCVTNAYSIPTFGCTMWCWHRRPNRCMCLSLISRLRCESAGSECRDHVARVPGATNLCWEAPERQR